MPDEVTKKDLQSLQGFCNKQIADVNKRIDNACKAVNDVSQRMVTGDSDVNKRVDNACKAVNDVSQRMEAGDSALTKRLAELEARVSSLEK